MKSIFLLQLQRLRREPLMVLSMLGMTFIFVFFLGGFKTYGQLDVPVYLDQSMNEEEQDALLAKLNESESYVFTETDQKTAEKQVALGDAAFAMKGMSDNYRMLTAADDPNQVLVDQYVKQIYVEKLRLKEAEQATGDADYRSKVEAALVNAPITLTASTAEGESTSGGYSQRNHFLFGMTLFFSIYTIIFSLSKVAEEKRTGTWNRVILSPVKKLHLYIGHLAYSFMIGFLQIVFIFSVFRYGFDYEIGDNYGMILVAVACYTFAVVALGMLLLGLVKSLEQLNALVPIISVSMAMIGGAYWPIEAVSNNVILGISKVVPVTYGMEALKGISLGQSMSTLAQPLAILVVIGVLCMGIGINLMERKV
ncbi:ABC transporter permease [Sediminibacillus halophilus]|uniref:ABC-2 type transport system permease protein n=1 Tax=Sediminibacillus halophilus TaxID=482461 RepID=A0A1G9NFW7_9BACI|nr:ABC transporter permease [Sediminibacillus halophilus]SDL85458.1 ABC-2 type transport system permease protein [Sediminibacillus halophilus]